jgi:UDP-N-acetylmuramoylalanine--D-glutamate ligase
MLIADLELPRVAILGAGREGRSVWREIRRRFPRKPLVIYTETPITAAFAGDFQSENDRVVEGPLDGAELARHEILIRSPGISPYRKSLALAKQVGAEFTTATSLWFAEHPNARTICITGTKGKSTTSALTAHLLKASGCTVQLAGNIGRPLLDCRAADVDWWVIELSSYQLADLEAQPTIAVILNLSDAHLEWHGDGRTYRADKLRIADLCPEALLVANHGDAELCKALGERAGITWFGRPGGFHVHDRAVWGAGGQTVLESPAALPGEHNLSNLCAALTVLELAGAGSPNPQVALESFEGLPHRLQNLGARDGIAYVNDSMATTPVATLAALQALEGGAVTLIIGGTESDVDWNVALQKMHAHPPHAIIALPNSGPALVKAARAAGISPAAGLHEAADLADAVKTAREVTPAGGTVLLSPGAPSFPQFRDYADRGYQFSRLAGVTK